MIIYRYNPLKGCSDSFALQTLWVFTGRGKIPLITPANPFLYPKGTWDQRSLSTDFKRKERASNLGRKTRGPSPHYSLWTFSNPDINFPFIMDLPISVIGSSDPDNTKSSNLSSSETEAHQGFPGLLNLMGNVGEVLRNFFRSRGGGSSVCFRSGTKVWRKH